MRSYLDDLADAINTATEALTQAEVESHEETILANNFSNERRRLHEAFYRLCAALEDREIKIQKLVLLGEAALIDRENMYLLEPVLKEIKFPESLDKLEFIKERKGPYR